MKNYTCAICGKQHDSLEAYLSCVNKCGEKLKRKEEEKAKQKRLEEINAALNRVKEAKKYFEEQLADFEKKYPEEYKINFGKENKECKCHCKDTKEDEPSVYTFSYEDNGKDKPIIKANGKEVSLETLLSDPDAKYLVELLEILD